MITDSKIINPNCPTCQVELDWFEIIGNWIFIDDYAFEKNLGVCPCCNRYYTWTSRYLNDNYELSFDLKRA